MTRDAPFIPSYRPLYPIASNVLESSLQTTSPARFFAQCQTISYTLGSVRIIYLASHVKISSQPCENIFKWSRGVFYNRVNNKEKQKNTKSPSVARLRRSDDHTLPICCPQPKSGASSTTDLTEQSSWGRICRLSCLKKIQNAPRPSEHPPVRGKKCQNVQVGSKAANTKPLHGIQTGSPMVGPLGQQYNIGEKPTVVLYTYIDRHAGTP